MRGASFLHELRLWPTLWHRRRAYPYARRAWLPVIMFGLPVAAVAGIVSFAYLSSARLSPAQLEALQRQAEVAQRRADDLECLAQNVYFESRGEPLAGQRAVAEVTLNRTHHERFPRTVCGVVHETRWSPEHRRYVADFSWTELGPLAPQGGPAWKQALAVASAAYDEVSEPVVPGALYYHATSVRPPWSRTHRYVATIGRHRFYR